MWPEDLKAIYSRMKNLKILGEPRYPLHSRPFIFQEVIDMGNEGVKKQEYNGIGTIIDFVYGIVLGRVFRGLENLSVLKEWGYPYRGLLPSNDALVMVDNHDNQRGHGAGGATILTHKDPQLYKVYFVHVSFKNYI